MSVASVDRVYSIWHTVPIITYRLRIPASPLNRKTNDFFVTNLGGSLLGLTSKVLKNLLDDPLTPFLGR